MAINWYPGHMHKARKDIIKTLNKIDIIIELVDARVPFSSQNPVIAEWRKKKPFIVILTKSDLADDETTQQWQNYLENSEQCKSIAYTDGNKEQLKQIVKLCHKLAPEKASFKPINALITGIPNVGKSTLINALAGKIIAKVGNEPAITKQQQKINLDDQLCLFDTPGILWPKINNPDSGYRLAMIGSIRNTAIDIEDIGFYAAEFFKRSYPNRLSERYQLESLPEQEVEILELIGSKRGAKQAGGRINLHKTSEILLNDFRSGNLGKVTLETPQQMQKELQKIAQENAE